jgi:hypothetical protein
VISHPAVKVQFDDFAASASKLMRRGPRGSRASIPADTLLSSHDDGIMVETSVLSSLVNSDRSWRSNLSVDAKKLVEVCKNFTKLGAAGQAIEVSVEKRQLCLKFRTTRISIPTLWIK